MQLVTVFLTCANKEEATKISKALVEKKLTVCSKMLPIHSFFFWNDKSDENDEVLLIMDSVNEKFEEMEEVVRGIHSYEQFVMFSVPILKTNKGTAEWILSSINTSL
jgi:periplasmic divalent cation tolerance protein